MKLAIPINPETSLGSEIMAKSFTDTDLLCIYDSVENKKNTLIISDLLAQYKSENLVLILKELGITSVVSSRFMPMAMRFFERNNITMLRATVPEVQKIIESFKNNELQHFTNQDAVEVGCVGHCGSCTSEKCGS